MELSRSRGESGSEGGGIQLQKFSCGAVAKFKSTTPRSQLNKGTVKD